MHKDLIFELINFQVCVCSRCKMRAILITTSYTHNHVYRARKKIQQTFLLLSMDLNSSKFERMWKKLYILSNVSKERMETSPNFIGAIFHIRITMFIIDCISAHAYYQCG